MMILRPEGLLPRP